MNKSKSKSKSMSQNKSKSMDFIPHSDIRGEAEVDEKKPWKDDALERQKFSRHLTNLVNSVRNAPFCVAVDGGWGSGKTFFLKRWRAEFARKDKAVSRQGNVIYFNAWEDDFHVDPLTAIIGQLQEEIKDPMLKKAVDSCVQFCNSIFKKVSLGLLGKGLGNVSVTKEDWQTGVDVTVEEYLKTRKNVTELKNRLEELAKTVRNKTKLPLVIIVDELDRCRPTFAIELLERVKHVVGVPGVIFVFGVNLKELEKSIQSIYGDIDATDYLRRFFDVGMTLPKAEASKYCLYLINKRKISKAIEKSSARQSVLTRQSTLRIDMRGIKWRNNMGIIIKNDLPIIVDYMGLSLRQIEQVVRMLSIVLHNRNFQTRGIPLVDGWWVIFVLLRITDRDLYAKFINKDCTIKDVLDGMLSSLSWENYSKIFLKRDLLPCIERMMSIFYFCSGEDRQEIVNEFEQVSMRLQGKGVLPSVCRYVPQKIIEIKNSSTLSRLACDLIEQIKSEVKPGSPGKIEIKESFYPSRQQVVQLLEWGDNWRF